MSQPQQQQNNGNQQQKQDRPDYTIQKSKDTYFLLIEQEPDFARLREKLLTKYAPTEARIVRELRLPRLLDKHTVITVSFDHAMCPKGCVDEENRRTCRVHESKPVSCARHWDAGADDGLVNVSTLMSELQASSIPGVLKRNTEGTLLRLAYA